MRYGTNIDLEILKAKENVMKNFTEIAKKCRCNGQMSWNIETDKAH